MSDVTTSKPRQMSAIQQFHGYIYQRTGEFTAALPDHIPAARFQRIVMTAIQRNNDLLNADRRSLWNSCMLAAQDGLLLDGREAALVVFDGRDGKQVQYMPMIAGIRKKARNSGEIATWDCFPVYSKDEFDYQLGDEPYIRHKPSLDADRGRLIGAYSICVLKSGERSREFMSASECHAIRDRSRAWQAFKAGKIKSTPWQTDEAEMVRKTVAKRHAKSLPMSTDLDTLIRRDDNVLDLEATREPARSAPPPPPMPAIEHAPEPEPVAVEHDPETGEVIDEPAPEPQPAPKRRGRPRKTLEQFGQEGPPRPPENAPTATPAPPEPYPDEPDQSAPHPGEPDRSAPDPIALAYDAGANAWERNVALFPVPPQYKVSQEIEDAWKDGWRKRAARATHER